MDNYSIHLVRRDTDGLWHLEHEGASLATFPTQAEGERAGLARGHQLFGEGQQAALVVHREDGSVDHECTFGRYPGWFDA